MKDVILIGDGNRDEIKKSVQDLKAWITNYCNLVNVDLDGTLALEDAEADLVITLGGDGAVLQATHRMGSNQLPLLGVNLGKLGFLSTLESEELEAILPELLKGELDITPRMRLNCELNRTGEANMIFSALNDAVVTRGGISRMVSLEIRIDGERMASFDGDGVVVSTPTGSTAHNLSAGGPVMEPNVRAFVITPLAPHTLTLRPLVVSDESEIEIAITATPEEAVLTVDGQMFAELGADDRLTIKRTDPPARLVQPPNRTFYTTLNKKLQWGTHPVSGS